ncbi:MAG TPA: acyltransferase [Caulobacteraceae bacterium]|nr:acyltransferase [Caulobacteraceae bacterium]
MKLLKIACFAIRGARILQSRRHYRTIEGLRGVGAALIVMRHAPELFGGVRVPESFLAVDLFYLVSGFVVAHAYGERLARGGFAGRFMLTRLIRLYPLYLLGLAIGLAPAIIASVTDPEGWWSLPRVAEAAATGLFMIPLFPGLAANGSSLDGPTWTLLWELVANLAYALAIRFMNLWALIATIVVCGAGVVFAEWRYGTLDVGFNPTDQWAALARVGFSFFAGVLLFRVAGEGERRSEWIAWALMALLAVALGFQPAAWAAGGYQLALVLVGFPALVLVAGRFEPSAISGRVFSFIGLMSYAVYLLHQPLAVLAREGLDRIDWDADDLIPWLTGPAFLAFLLILAWRLDKQYDAPARNWLRARLMPSAGKAAEG